MGKGNTTPLNSSLSLDTTDFKANLTSANREIRVLESSFRASTATLGDWSKTSEGLEARVKTLGSQMDIQKRKVDGVSAEYKKVAKEKGATSRAAQELEIKLNKENETLGKMQSELDQSEKALKDMGKGSDKAGKDVKELEKHEKATGKETNEFGQHLNKTIGVLGKFAIALGVGALIKKMGDGLKSIVSNAINASGELVDLGNKTGFTVQQLQEMQYIGGQVGVDLETMTGSLSKLTRSMADAKDGGAAADVFKKLGVAVTDSSGALRNNNEVYQEALAALGQISNPTERDALALELFGKSALELNPLIKTSADEMAAMTKEATELGAVVDTDTVNSLESLGDGFASLKASAEGNMMTLASSMAPALSGMIDIGKSTMKEFTDIISGSNGDLAAAAPRLGGLLGKLLTTIVKKIPGMGQAGLGILQGLMGAIVQNMPLMAQTVSQLLMLFLSFIISSLPMIMDGGMQIVLAIADALISNAGQLITSATAMIVTLIQGLAAAAPQLITKFVELIPIIIEALLSNLPLLIEASLVLIMAIITGLANALPQLVGYIPEIITAIVTAIGTALPMIVKAAGDIISALLNGLVATVFKLRNIGAKILETIKSAIDGKSFAEIGKNIVLGIWEGIKGMWESLKGWFSGLLKGLKGTADNAVKSHSPSKLFADVGMNIGAGLGVGIKESMKNVKRDLGKAMADLGGMDTPTLNLGANINARGAAAAMPATIINNFYVNNKLDAEIVAAKVVRMIRA